MTRDPRFRPIAGAISFALPEDGELGVHRTLRLVAQVQLARRDQMAPAGAFTRAVCRGVAAPIIKRMSGRMTVVDLFAGAGGATQGLIDAGWTVLASVENDELAAKSYAQNHPTVELRVTDIESLDPKELREDLKLRCGDLALLKACPPCQGYSTLGPTDPTDPRNDLVHEVWRFAREFVPKAILMENVPGLRNDDRLAELLRRLAHHGLSAGLI
jgi:C-5 cytosine-specific DNA methylase